VFMRVSLYLASANLEVHLGNPGLMAINRREQVPIR